MNLQQFEYLVAVDDERHFVRAADKCFVTQATLSMMIRKLEDELQLQVFDRSKHPVEPTREGQAVIARARQIVNSVRELRQYARELRGEITGELRLGVIPTLAPYLLPLFLHSFSERFPSLRISVREMMTHEIIQQLNAGTLDAALLATPLREKNLAEMPLFYEEFVVYASRSEKLPAKKYLAPAQLNQRNLWLLEEGHCMKDQLVNLCALREKRKTDASLHYQAGSIESLIRLVDTTGGITVIPKLAAVQLSSAQKKNLRHFVHPTPVREVSLISLNSYPRTKLLTELKIEIRKAVRRAVPLDEKGLRVVNL